MAVPVSNGGGPFVVLTGTGVPDIIEMFGRADPEEVVVEVICGGPGVVGEEGVGVGAGALEVEGDEGGRVVGLFGVGGAEVGT